jgi:hypothetical protein
MKDNCGKLKSIQENGRKNVSKTKLIIPFCRLFTDINKELFDLLVGISNQGYFPDL